MTDLEQIETLISQAMDLINKAKGEDRDLTAEESTEVEGLYSRAKAIENRAVLEKKFKGFNKEAIEDAANAAVKAVATKTFNKETPKMEIETKPADEKASYAEGIKHFARTGDYKKFAITTGSNGGALIGTTVMEPMVTRQPSNAIRKGLAALGIKTEVSASTENAKLPFFDDSANKATKLSSATDGSANSESECNPCRELLPAITNKDVNLVEYRSEPVFYSKRFVNAQSFDVAARTIPMLDSRIERQEEADWVTTLKAGLVAGNTVTQGTLGTVLADEVIDTDESLSVAYDELPSFWVVSKGFRKAIRKLKDTTGEYILGYENGVATLFGKPVFVSASLDAPSVAGGVSALLIAAEGLVVRDSTANELVRYEGESAHPNQIGFEEFSYSGFNFAGAAVAAYKNHA